MRAKFYNPNGRFLQAQILEQAPRVGEKVLLPWPSNERGVSFWSVTDVVHAPARRQGIPHELIVFVTWWDDPLLDEDHLIFQAIFGG